jgi:hypothetical protein
MVGYSGRARAWLARVLLSGRHSAAALTLVRIIRSPIVMQVLINVRSRHPARLSFAECEGFRG